MLANITNRDCDRFIPNRQHFKLDHPQNSQPDELGQPSANYNYLISKRLFNNKQNCPTFNLSQQLAEYRSEMSIQSTHSCKLKINVSSPVKILDIPCFKDDFYLNNIDWSQSGPLGIALNKQIYLYKPQNITQIGRNTFRQEVSGIKINQKLMAVGCTNGSAQIYDLERSTIVRTLLKHQNRVAALMFMDDLLVTGSKDKTILVHDLRQRYHCIKEYVNHKGQICTLKAKNKSQKIFASGSVDGSAIIWDLKYGFIDQLKGHKGAVKALDWCPWKSGILATGGGNQKDKSIKLWNTNNSKLLLQESIQDQISGIVWNQQLKMMITSHGLAKNQLNFWNLNTSQTNGRWRLQKKKSFEAHSRRVLNIVQPVDGSYLCTAGGDQTLKLWSLTDNKTNPFFPQPQRERNDSQFRI